MTSSIDIANPAAGSAGSSAVIRANFVAAYNDINSLQATFAGLPSTYLQLTGGTVTGNLVITNTGGLTVAGASALANLSLSGTLGVTGASTLSNTSINGTLGVTALATFTVLNALHIENSPIGATTPATGAFTTLSATGSTTLAGLSAGAVGASTLTLSSTLGVTGTSTLGVVNAGATTAASLSVTGATTLTGSLTANNATNTINALAITNNATIGGTLNVTGTATLSSLALGSLNNTPVGNTTPSTGAFTTLSASGAITGFAGRLLNVRYFTSSGTYTPTTGTNSVLIEVQAGGGGSGGTQTTTSSQIAFSPGGGAGAYGRKWVTSGFSGVTITVGAGGLAGAAGASGGLGGTSSFGSIVTCSGGGGSGIGTAYANTATTRSFSAGNGSASGADFSFVGSVQTEIGLISGTFVFGSGNASFLGPGGTAQATPTGYGGGAGSQWVIGTSSALTGYPGAPGLVVVWEYS